MRRTIVLEGRNSISKINMNVKIETNSYTKDEVDREVNRLEDQLFEVLNQHFYVREIKIK